MMDFILQYRDYTGVLIGFIVLLAAVFLLPSGIRSHVLTAGVSLLLFRTWQIYSNKHKLAKADQKWAEIKQQQKQLQQQRDKLVKQTEQLRQEQIQIERQVKDLKQQQQKLETESQQHSEEKQQLDKQLSELLKQDQSKQQQRQQTLATLRDIAAANRQLNNISVNG
ncbi:hypothetical protein [Neptunicella marina]|uniref:Uncharacterized protein n=1 Tax=Neptunicella marina TaxID=2125989 RepID=A0A8J6M3I7_9ALTE|nr:hypothetical protein [Neptunicella marina]MBC3767513.1 hypothetical protein [Neptunicella marina]